MFNSISAQLIITVAVFFHFGHLNIIDHRFFLAHLIEKYGHNGSISYEGFEKLYINLGLGGGGVDDDRIPSTTKPSVLESPSPNLRRNTRQTSGVSSDDCKTKEELQRLVSEHKEVESGMEPPPTHRCLSPRELLIVYGLSPQSTSLTPISFLHLCPAIIYELDIQTCITQHRHEEDPLASVAPVHYTTWVYASLTILLISVSGLLSVALVPLLHKTFINQLISFLVALAVGTLLGDAFLHLIPHALQSHDPNDSETHGHTDSLVKTGLVFLTVVFFFTFESILNVIRTVKKKRSLEEKQSYVTVDGSQFEKELMEVTTDVHIHSHSHSPKSNIALMVVMGDGLHNLTDGLAIGAAFSGGLAPGFATAFAVFTHELPHELGDFAVLIQSGMTVRRAMLYNLVSSVLSFLGMVAGLIIGNFGESTQFIYAITAGSFIYIALANLVPEINKEESNWRFIALRLSGILCGGATMGAIALYEDQIHNLFS